MRKIVMTLAFVALSLMTFATEGDGKTLKVVNTESVMNWKGSKVTGSHIGTINVALGTLEMDGNTLKSAQVIIDMTSIACTDADMRDEYKSKLVGHLSSADFFNTAKFDTATFDLTSFEPIESKDGKNYQVTGNLTIKGITNAITFPAKVAMSGKGVTVEAKVSIDRTKWDIKYGSGSFIDNLGDNMIYDEMDIDFMLVAK
jgi:polyisoprenoid-binding protein YceI